MRVLRAFFLTLLLSSSLFVTQAFSGNFGVNIGAGIPFVTQAGVSYQFNDKFAISLGYGRLDLDVDTAGVELTMPEVMFYYHPFSGAFYLGAGIGSETLEATATDSGSGNSITAEVDATTTIARLGWKWGIANGGFWYGMDVSYIMPSGGETEITSNTGGLPSSNAAYQDVIEAGDEFGETSYVNITLIRLGYIF